jgi:hypothetical protein
VDFPYQDSPDELVQAMSFAQECPLGSTGVIQPARAKQRGRKPVVAYGNVTWRPKGSAKAERRHIRYLVGFTEPDDK